MKIRRVLANNRKKVFAITTAKGVLEFPFSELNVRPTSQNPIVNVYVDRECSAEAFTYELSSGISDTVPLDAVLEFNSDTDYMREMLLYDLTIKAQELLEQLRISKREVTRRLKTSPAQVYRLLDQTNYDKSIDQMVKLLGALDCRVELKFTNAA